MHIPIRGRIWSLSTGFLSILAHAAAGRVTDPLRVPKKAVLLSDVASLTLRAGKSTSSRRVKAVPQLECVGPPDICKLYQVDVMRCTNEGADYDADNIQWSCKASLPEDFKLGSTDVVCEGYESSDDPYVLKGSCGVEYRLLLTDKGLRRYQRQAHPETPDQAGQPSKVFGILFMILFLGVVFWIIKGLWNEARRNPPRRGGGGRPYGGDGGDNDPPPPYDYPPGYSQPARKQNTRPGTGRSGASSSQARAQPQQAPWRPGFWTGAATGAAAGYTANRFMNRSQTAAQHDTTQRQRPSSESRPAFAPASRSSPSHSNEQHESTGFGDTRRR